MGVWMLPGFTAYVESSPPPASAEVMLAIFLPLAIARWAFRVKVDAIQ